MKKSKKNLKKVKKNEMKKIKGGIAGGGGAYAQPGGLNYIGEAAKYKTATGK